MSFALLIGISGFDGFSISAGAMPLWSVLLIIGLGLSLVFFLTTNSYEAPIYSGILATLGFASAINWMNIEANEVVAILESFGYIFNLDTALLGLTILAIGNSVGDLVADTTVAKTGRPEMGVASTFGSSLLNDVLGLGISLTAWCINHYPSSFSFDIHSSNFAKVKLSWIFLCVSLFTSLIVFPVTKFNPPKIYGISLVLLYVLFMTITILEQVKVIKIFTICS